MEGHEGQEVLKYTTQGPAIHSLSKDGNESSRSRIGASSVGYKIALLEQLSTRYRSLFTARNNYKGALNTMFLFSLKLKGRPTIDRVHCAEFKEETSGADLTSIQRLGRNLMCRKSSSQKIRLEALTIA